MSKSSSHVIGSSPKDHPPPNASLGWWKTEKGEDQLGGGGAPFSPSTGDRSRLICEFQASGLVYRASRQPGVNRETLSQRERKKRERTQIFRLSTFSWVHRLALCHSHRCYFHQRGVLTNFGYHIFQLYNFYVMPPQTTCISLVRIFPVCCFKIMTISVSDSSWYCHDTIWDRS